MCSLPAEQASNLTDTTLDIAVLKYSAEMLVVPFFIHDAASFSQSTLSLIHPVLVRYNSARILPTVSITYIFSILHLILSIILYFKRLYYSTWSYTYGI